MRVKVSAEPLDPAGLIKHVRDDAAGATVLFSGVVRNHNNGRKVVRLEYDAYPEMAEKMIREIAAEVRARWPVMQIAVQHRTGRLEIGESALLVAVSSAHRRDAFEAAAALIDRIKESVPIWKREVFDSGEEWIEGERGRDATAKSSQDRTCSGLERGCHQRLSPPS